MRRILAVDDDPHICLAIRAWLKRYGFDVALADGGASGLLVFGNSTFDLMIVDIPALLGHVCDNNAAQGFRHPRAFRDAEVLGVLTSKTEGGALELRFSG